MAFIVFLACFAAFFAWALRRVTGSHGPGLRSEPSRGEEGRQMWVITGTGGPALGTPESLVDNEGLSPSEAASRRRPVEPSGTG